MTLHYFIHKLPFSITGAEPLLEPLLKMLALSPFRLPGGAGPPGFCIHVYKQGEQDTVPHKGLLLKDYEGRCLVGQDPSAPFLYMEAIDGSRAVLTHDANIVSFRLGLCLGSGKAARALYLALYACYCLAGLRRGLVPLHAACIAYQGQALLFLGPSGIGKSTQARLWLHHLTGSRLLSDDHPVLGTLDGRLSVSGSPWGGGQPATGPQPLKAWVCLQQAPYNRLLPLSAPIAYQVLLQAFPPFLLLHPRARPLALALASDFLARQPLRQFHCLPLPSAPALLHQQLYT